MSERLSLVVEDGTADALTRLAGGERKRGQWLSDLVHAMELHGGQKIGGEFEMLKQAHLALSGQVRVLDGRVMALEATVAVLVADREM